MFHILLFLLHRQFKETYFNLIRSSNHCSQMLFLFLMGLTVARCRFPQDRVLSHNVESVTDFTDVQVLRYWSTTVLRILQSEVTALIVSILLVRLFAFSPQDQLTFTSADLKLKFKITVNLFSFFGMLLDEQLSSLIVTKDHRVTVCRFNCLPICIKHLVRNFGCAYTPSWSLLDAEQKMGSMW